MRLEISNLFGIDALDVEFDDNTVTLVTGANREGKTSLALALGAVAAMDGNPLGLSAASRKAYVKDGAFEGWAELGECQWNPVTGFTAPTDASGAKATSEATGLVDFIHKRSEKERARLFEEFFVPEDAAEALKEQWPDAAPQLDAVAGIIQRDGWDSALKLRRRIRPLFLQRFRSVFRNEELLE